jgi:predicted GH43/DUF377 family glycosyl hydrolase
MKLERRNFIKLGALLAVPGLPALNALGTSTDDAAYADDATLLNVDVKKQLFFDNLLIESVQDVNREFHQPRKDERNPLIVKDKPWEHVVYIRTSSGRVLRDPKDNLFKAWYTDWWITNEQVQRGLSWPLCRNEYAYSEDGIHWVKPKLGIFKENGEDTNIYFGDEKTGTVNVRDVIIDPFESDESRRFKSIYLQAPVDSTGEGHYEKSHFFIAYSADGIHWKNYDQSPSFGKLGSQLNDVVVLNYDLDNKLYILNTRHRDMGRVALNPRLPRTKSFFPPYSPDSFSRMNKRRIFQCESKDLIHWNEPRIILGPDEQDNLDDYMYGMSQYRVGDTWVGFLNMLHGVPDSFDVQLAYSLDGRRWRRVRKPWLTAGPPGSWDQFMAEFCIEPIEVGDELWLYYCGNGYGHHDWFSEWVREGNNPPDKDVNKVGYYLGLAKLRLDGFCSLNAGPVREGILALRQLNTPGTGVVINAECGPDGYVEVEVLNQADEVIPGFGRRDFDRFTGNATKQQLSWKGETKIPVQSFRRLVFYMRNAKLYSFNFSA